MTWLLGLIHLILIANHYVAELGVGRAVTLAHANNGELHCDLCQTPIFAGICILILDASIENGTIKSKDNPPKGGFWDGRRGAEKGFLRGKMKELRLSPNIAVVEVRNGGISRYDD